MWAYGCDRKGGLYSSVVRKTLKIRGLGWTVNFRAALAILLKCYRRKPEAWRAVYRNVKDASQFRTWLRMVHSPQHNFDLGEGFGPIPLSKFCGLFTYRYIMLTCLFKGEAGVLWAIRDYDQLRDLDTVKCFVDRFIRNEKLETDLYTALVDLGLTLGLTITEDSLSIPWLNPSSRRDGLQYYYDQETAEIVAERDRLILEKFAYLKPEF